MSNQIILFGQDVDYTPEEIKTRDEEWKILKPVVDRLSNSKMDNLTIAASLIRIREKHGYNSSLYRDAVEHVKENFAGWDSGDYRKRVSLAAQGFNHLAGSHKEKEWIVKKLNPSFSALAACVNIPDRLVHTFTTKELKKLEKFPTADAIEQLWTSTGRSA